jgi:hypothetical protein
MNKYNTYKLVWANILLLVTGVIGLWATDIGHSGMVLQSHFGKQIQTENIFGFKDPNVTYHLGLIVILTSMIALVGTNLWYRFFKS